MPFSPIIDSELCSSRPDETVKCYRYHSHCDVNSRVHLHRDHYLGLVVRFNLFRHISVNDVTEHSFDLSSASVFRSVMRAYIVHTRKPSSVLLAYRCRGCLTVELTCLACHSISRALLQIDYGGAFVRMLAFIRLQVSSILSATVLRNLMINAIKLSTVGLQLDLSEISTLAESSVLVEISDIVFQPLYLQY